ncbi:MAG: D-alanyl-D-alanine carboxypeptidase [Ruminococcaceae bacterium]|nr:D-alanyl-D-alanine carboxypeptidase [Oscillospiraceae bacterium]
MGKRIWTIILVAVLLLGVPIPAQATDLQLDAPSAVLMDLETGTVLYELNAREKLAPASVTKVMTMLLIMEAVDAGRISWGDMVTASETAAAKGGSQVYLKVGETMSVEDMVKSIAVSSANDCACAMAEFIAGSEAGFVEMMNRRAQELGMSDTHFVNCTGLDDDPAAAEHLTTAYDIALMSRELLKNHPDIKRFTTIWMDSVRGGAFGLSNTNKLVRFYEGTTGLKTGYTSAAGHCLSASAKRENLELVAVVLNCPNSAARFESAKALLDYGFANYALIEVQEEELPTVEVILGKSQSLQVTAQGEAQLLVDKALLQGVTRTVELPQTIEAPVAPGQVLGTLTVESGGKILATVPLVAAEEVERLSWWELFRLALGAVSMAEGENNI